MYRYVLYDIKIVLARSCSFSPNTILITISYKLYANSLLAFNSVNKTVISIARAPMKFIQYDYNIILR